jgi:hypothetical protein
VPFLPHALPKERVPVASLVRGTVILSSIRGLRAHGLTDRYFEALPREYHPAINALTAATWLPMELAMAHYSTCDRLNLDRSLIEAIGAESGRFVNQTVLSVMSRLSQEGGLTPWFALANSQKMTVRTWTGSSMAVYKLGPKDARIEWIRHPPASVRYFRVAFASFTHAICAMFARSIVVREMAPTVRESELGVRLSWV